eukprot:SAG22_NODE_2501_length_2507_cov_1.744911_3_plen_115_part_00
MRFGLGWLGWDRLRRGGEDGVMGVSRVNRRLAAVAGAVLLAVRTIVVRQGAGRGDEEECGGALHHLGRGKVDAAAVGSVNAGVQEGVMPRELLVQKAATDRRPQAQVVGIWGGF